MVKLMQQPEEWTGFGVIVTNGPPHNAQSGTDFESAEQYVECLLVVVVVLPIGEAPDMPRAFDAVGPTCLSLHIRII
jgi:hypothetical protein